MNFDIKVTKSSQSKANTVDFNNIPFGRVFSDHLFVCEYKDGQWQNPRVEPFANITMSPANMALHYGQAIFEGMKATKLTDGTPALFRPQMHIERLNNSAARMCMPAFPEGLFHQALEILMDLDRDWIPPVAGSALYIRPFMFAADEFLGVRPSETYKMMIFTGPVGPYYPKPVNLLTSQKYIRAAQGGTGEAKAAGNYAGTLLPMQLANKAGYDQILWLDAKEHRYLQEVGTMNIFFVIDGKVITPETTGTILKGITRDSFIHILKDKGYTVEERPITIEELTAAYDDGKLEEVFGSGTAAVVSLVNSITHAGKTMDFSSSNFVVANMLKAEINGLRAGEVEDTRGWLKLVAPKATLV